MSGPKEKLLTFIPVILLMILGISIKPILTETLGPGALAHYGYEDSITQIQVIQRNEQFTGISSSGQSILMEHGQKAAKAIVFFHGFTSNPRQFEELGKKFFELGYNVYIPRLPHHGKYVELQPRLEKFMAEDLVNATDIAVNIGQGLGKHVSVAGISMGGVMAAWAAQYRSEVDQAVILSPNFGTYRLPNFLLKASVNLLLTFPSYDIWWDSKLKDDAKLPLGKYKGFSSHAIAEVRRLAFYVQGLSKKIKPKAKEVIVITNNNDGDIQKQYAEELRARWEEHGQEVKGYEFPERWELPADFIDPLESGQKIKQVYPKLIELIGGEWIDWMKKRQSVSKDF